MPVARSTVIGAVSGVVLLAGVVGFAVGLPEVTGDTATASESAPMLPELPDRLAGGLEALDTIEGTMVPGQSESSTADKDESAAKRLGELYDTDVVVRSYLRNDQANPAILALTVIPGEEGLLAPSGPPFSPELDGMARGSYELVDVDGTHCAVAWEQPVPIGTEPDPAAVPLFTQCQLVADGLLYDGVAQRLTAEQVAGILEDVSDR